MFIHHEMSVKIQRLIRNAQDKREPEGKKVKA